MDFQLLIFLITAFFCNSCLARKKHVVVIVADDLGWNDVSFHGSNQFLTPNIDALAYSSTILHNYYVLPLCSPSRCALLSGIHPIHTGMHHRVIYAAQPYGLPLNVKILPQYLKEYGYKTHAVGKWHLGNFKEVYTPTKRGFDSHFGYWNSHEDYYSHDLFEMFMKGKDFRRNGNVSRGYDGQYATDIFTRESINIIHSHNASEPLFLYLAHLAVHSANPKKPLQAPQEIIKKFSYIKDKRRRTFAAMVYKLDESVGLVVQALAQKGILQDTIIVFTTDNGGPAGGFNQNVASNWPLKGIKDTLWEGGVRGAAFIWSADLPNSRVNRALMHVQDWVPTILGGIDQNADENPELQKLDGRNMWPVLMGEKEAEYDEIILQRDDNRGIVALRKSNWKLIQGSTYRGRYDKWYGPSGRDANFTYNVNAIKRSLVAATLQNHFSFPPDDQMAQIRQSVTLNCDYCGDNNIDCIPCNLMNETCLFDIAEDPCERNNLAGKYPQILAEMYNRVKTYQPVPPLNQPIDLRADPIFWDNTWTNWMDYVDGRFNDSKTNSVLLSLNHKFSNMRATIDELMNKK